MDRARPRRPAPAPPPGEHIYDVLMRLSERRRAADDLLTRLERGELHVTETAFGLTRSAPARVTKIENRRDLDLVLSEIGDKHAQARTALGILQSLGTPRRLLDQIESHLGETLVRELGVLSDAALALDAGRDDRVLRDAILTFQESVADLAVEREVRQHVAQGDQVNKIVRDGRGEIAYAIKLGGSSR